MEVENIVNEPVDTSYHEHVQYRSGTLTIGCVGQPNVGKSSLMNAIMGKKVNCSWRFYTGLAGTIDDWSPCRW